jgi:hypothetical protein
MARQHCKNAITFSSFSVGTTFGPIIPSIGLATVAELVIFQLTAINSGISCCGYTITVNASNAFAMEFQNIYYYLLIPLPHH